MANLFDGDIVLQENDAAKIVWKNIVTGITLGYLIFVTSNPNGVLTAPVGSMAMGSGGPWVNIDGATGWVSITGGASSAVDMSANGLVPVTARSLFLSNATSGEEFQAWLPPVADFDGTSLFVRHAEGRERVQLVPAAGQAVNGPAGTPLLVHPGQGYTLIPDFTRGVWWIAGIVIDTTAGGIL